jgi:hypothetical protein
MTIPEKIKLMVKNQNLVNFTKYFDGALWYSVYWFSDDNKDPEYFEFPVPISDIGTATFLAKDKALLFMRYIRKHLETIENKE